MTLGTNSGASADNIESASINNEYDKYHNLKYYVNNKSDLSFFVLDSAFEKLQMLN